MYNHQIFDSNRKISFVVENEKLEKVLERLFKPFNIDYEQAGNKIILKRDLKLISIPEKVTVQNVEIIEQTVSGKVVDDKDNSLPGVNIMLKGTQKGTTSDASGNFSIVVPDDEAVLVFSSIGFDKKEVLVGKRINITVTLLADIKSLDEVIVVGYGTAKKATLTGSISTIDSKIFKDRGPVDNPLGALQGQVAGVTITRNSGQPGRENWNFQIRGAASTNSTEPLVIVDGLPVTGVSSLNSFNPNDIENISFLKDGSAAIYGSRAAGGVVLITTKRAKSGKVRIEYNASFSQKRVGLLPQLVDMNGWGPLIRDARAMDGFPATDIWLNYAKRFTCWYDVMSSGLRKLWFTVC
ncbi:MAG: TonB-dependent receptor plug domain-containing protein [Bacteroidota bacterium]